MKRLSLILFVFILHINCFGQRYLKGSIKDENNSPLPFVNVILTNPVDSSQVIYGTVTDLEGRFLFKNIKPENYLVITSMVGFKRNRTLVNLIDEKDTGQDLYADSAYVGQEDVLEKHQVKNKIHEKGYKNNPLTERQRSLNTEKSRTRVRIEHIFGFMENTMDRMFFRKIGLKRAEASIGLVNLTYNMFRKIQLTEQMTGTCVYLQRNKSISTIIKHLLLYNNLHIFDHY